MNSMVSPSLNISAAQDLAVFPLLPGMKIPAIEQWQLVPVGRYQPVGNYGIALQADQLVLDFDSYKESGQASLERFFKRYPSLRTRIVQTPRGGYHVYLKKPPHVKVKQKQTLWPGVDFQSEGRYVCGPGTTTVETKDSAAGTYQILGDPQLGSAAEADTPADFLAELELATENAVLTGSEASLAMSNDFRLECQLADPAIEGQGGDDTTYKLACRGRDMALPADAVYQHMRDEWNPRCSPPWGEGELYEKVKHAFRYAKNAAGNKSPGAIFTPPGAPDMVPAPLEGLDMPPPPSSPQSAAVPARRKDSEQVDENIQALFGEAAEFWRDSTGTAYATIQVNGHKEHHRIGSVDFRLWLQFQYRSRYHKLLSSSNERLRSNIEGMEAYARFNGTRHQPAVRMAKLGGKLYVDLCNDNWEVIEVSAESWRVLTESPVKFVRTRNMQPLPMPENSSPEVFAELRGLLNLPNDDAWALFIGFVFACFNQGAPNPVLVLNGEHGSAKSFHAKAVRWLVDPAHAPTCGKLRDEKDLLSNAASGHVLALDNLSYLKNDLSDSICRLATEGGNSFRQLYSDGELFSFNFIKPIVLTGIESFVTRGDLLSRSIIIELPKIAEDANLAQEQLKTSFEAITPRVLGALLTAASAALRNVAVTNPRPLPRLADMAKWVTAGERELGLHGHQFLTAYWNNQREAAGISLEASPVAQYVLSMDLVAPWEGTAEELRQAVCATPRGYSEMASIPKTSKDMGNELRRVAPDLRKVGVEVIFGKRVANKRPVRIERQAQTSIEDLL